MSNNKIRCDHCKKWQEYDELFMPNTKEEYWDGTFAICSKCYTNEKYTQEYWTEWYERKTEYYSKLKKDNTYPDGSIH